MENYDEMHNHQLLADPGYMPLPKNHNVKAMFETPIFEAFSKILSTNFSTFNEQVIHLAKQRSFELELKTQQDYLH